MDRVYYAMADTPALGITLREHSLLMEWGLASMGGQTF